MTNEEITKYWNDLADSKSLGDIAIELAEAFILYEEKHGNVSVLSTFVSAHLGELRDLYLIKKKRTEPTMLNELNDGDWDEVFKYSNPELALGAKCSKEHFYKEDVQRIYFKQDGENDVSNWIMIGKLKDGRYFCIEAGCDYTGWGCQEWGQSWVSDDYDNLIQFGMTNEIRDLVSK